MKKRLAFHSEDQYFPNKLCCNEIDWDVAVYVLLLWGSDEGSEEGLMVNWSIWSTFMVIDGWHRRDSLRQKMIAMKMYKRSALPYNNNNYRISVRRTNLYSINMQ